MDAGNRESKASTGAAADPLDLLGLGLALGVLGLLGPSVRLARRAGSSLLVDRFDSSRGLNSCRLTGCGRNLVLGTAGRIVELLVHSCFRGNLDVRGII